MAKLNATSAASAASPKTRTRTKPATKTPSRKAKKSASKAPSPATQIAHTAPDSTEIREPLTIDAIYDGLGMESLEHTTESAGVAELVDALRETPEYNAALADHERRLAARAANASKADHKAFCDGLHAVRMFRAGWLAATSQTEAAEVQPFFDLDNVRAVPDCLNGKYGTFLKGVILAFCSYEELPYGQQPDVYPMPHQSFRAGNRMIFQLGTSELTFPTLSGLQLTKSDWVNVDPERKLYDNGDLVVAITEDRLTLLELRTYDTDRGPQIGPYELRTGTLLDERAVVIIGQVVDYSRNFNGPDSPGKREVDEMLKAARLARASKKGGAF